MKYSTTLSALLIVIFFCGCKKDKTISSTSINANGFLDSALQYLKSNLLQNEFDNLDVAKSKTFLYKGQNFGVEIFEKGETDNKFLLLQNKNGIYSGNWINMSGLTKTSIKFSSGNIILKSLDHNTITKLIVDSNKVIEMDKTTIDNSNKINTYFKSGKYPAPSGIPSSPETAATVLPDVIIYYDVNGGGGVDYYSWYWLLDQEGSSTYDYFNSGSGGGGGLGSSGSGNGPSNIVVALNYFPPDTPIKDLGKDLKCFTENSTSTYDVSVNINEPDPGTRDVVNALSAFPVGHTFLTLEQHNADGTSIIRTIGFYPKNTVKPGTETEPSVFGDDSDTPYDVSLDFSVTGAEMTKVVNRVLAQQAIQYDLNNFNCTNAAMDALQSINVNLPSTKSDGALFNGNDPGDLGEDVKGLNLNNFSTQNGDRKITRIVSNSNNQYSKGTLGGC